MVQNVAVMSKERLDRYILEAAKAVGYEEGFGVKGCDLSQRNWWVAYNRQSTREQSENERLGEYLLTCARLAKQYGVVVPTEYVVYDSDSSEDMNRSGIIWLRNHLIPGRHIAGIIIPFQGRLSADPLHQLTFERECNYYSVKVIYGDAPAGEDWASQTARLIQAQANALRVKTNRDNALGGDIARVLAGKVPAHRALYGYILRTEKTFDRSGRAKVLKAWWEVNRLDPDGKSAYGSPAWVVTQVFIWLADEDRTAYWVAAKLNELGIQSPYRPSWSPKTIINMASHRAYTGKGQYNVRGKFPNPDKPLGDLTMGVKRTLLRPKPENERVAFEVPALVSEDRWLRANKSLRERGRGRGKQGKQIQALFRARMLCPKCGKPMAVLLRKKGTDEVYYFCRAHYLRWLKDPCNYNRFIPGTWDAEIWGEVCEMLSNDVWLDEQLVRELAQNADIERLIRMQQFKINQATLGIGKIQEGWERGFYTAEESEKKLALHRDAIARAEAEIEKLQNQQSNQGLNVEQARQLRKEFQALRNRNLLEASFEEKADLVAKLGIKILPVEDLRSRKICCRLNLANTNEKEREQVGFTKVVYGGRYCTIRRTRQPRYYV